jgi:hypothetical protein
VDLALLRRAFHSEANYCEKTGSPFAAAFLRSSIADIERRGVVARLVEDYPGDPHKDVLPLRLMGAVHRSVLAGEAPALEPFYPSVGGRSIWPEAYNAVLEYIEEHGATIKPRLRRHVQTNEVGRSAVLLPGFLLLAARFDLPMRLLEIGASAGLNLLWDRYRYRLRGCSWGHQDSPLLLTTRWQGALPPLRRRVEVASRASCDVSPLDITDAEQVLTLKSFLWADQVDRLKRVARAVAMAQREPPHVERASAVTWLERELAQLQPGQLTVVYNSVMWGYLAPEDQRTIVARVEAAGEATQSDAPLAWLQFEGVNGHAELTLRIWPGGRSVLLAEAEYNAQWVRWRHDGDALGTG